MAQTDVQDSATITNLNKSSSNGVGFLVWSTQWGWQAKGKYDSSFQILKGCHNEDGINKQGETQRIISLFRIRRIFFTTSAIKQWIILPPGAADAPSLEVFNKKLDSYLSRIISALEMELNWEIFKVCSNSVVQSSCKPFQSQLGMS